MAATTDVYGIFSELDDALSKIRSLMLAVLVVAEHASDQEAEVDFASLAKDLVEDAQELSEKLWLALPNRPVTVAPATAEVQPPTQRTAPPASRTHKRP
jgi:hypothetical protein